MPQLSYAVDTELKRLRIYFDEKNPVESALLKQALVQFKMYGYKVPGTNLICIELALTEQVSKDFARYCEEVQLPLLKKKPKKRKNKKTT
jgi:hypothetical protein